MKSYSIPILLCLTILLTTLETASQIKEKIKTTYNSPVVSVNSHIYEIVSSCKNGNINFWNNKFGNLKEPLITYSPTGAYVATGNKRGIINLWAKEGNAAEKVRTIRKHGDKITSLGFNPRGNLLGSGSKDRTIKIWKTDGTIIHTLRGHSKQINSICFGPDNRYLVSGSDDETVKIWNIHSGSLVFSFSEPSGEVTSVDVSPDGKFIAAGDKNGEINLWKVKDKTHYKAYKTENSSITDVVFHPNSMYLFISEQSPKITIWNIKKEKPFFSKELHENTVNDLAISHDKNKNLTYLLSGSKDKTLKVWDVQELPPRYEFLVKRYADKKIEQWDKKRPDESSEEYRRRVTKGNRREQYQSFTQEAINQYALENYELAFDSIDNYDRYNETFRLKSQELGNIILSVPPNEAKSFIDNFHSLQYENPRFSLTQKNFFVLSYLEVVNPANNKTYVYNEKAEQKFEETEISLDAAPIHAIKQVAKKEEILKEKLNKFTEKMHKEKKISDNIETSVNAKAEVAENEEGEKEVNLNVEYKYRVIKASVEGQTDDFPPGEYRFSTSNAAKATLQVLANSLENELAEYLQKPKKVTIKITGSTDATPISGTIPYNGEYGEFKYEPYYLNDNLESITITEETGITKNEQLAFLRTQGVKHFIDQYITILKGHDINYQHYAELSEEEGAEHRKIAVDVTIHNAFGDKEPPSSIMTEEELSDVDKNIPENDSIKQPHTYALVIGNEDYCSYQKGLDKEANVDFAVHDAKIFKKYLNKTLGVPLRQIKLIENGTAGQIRQGLAWISNLAKIEKGKASIIFYYSGHGLPDEETREPYIIPVDVSGNNLQYAIKLHEIYNILTQYSSKRVISFIDACFSGSGKSGNLVEKKGVKIEPKEKQIHGKTLVFSSSSGRESSHVYSEKSHGYFTYFLLKKMKETNGNVTYKELTDYVKTKVQKETALDEKLQTPEIKTGKSAKEEWTEWKLVPDL